MQETVAKGILNYLKDQTPEFEHIIQDFYDTDQGFTDSLNRRLVKKQYSQLEKPWVAVMWNMMKPEPLSHRPKIFKAKEIQWVNNRGDLVLKEEAQDPVTLKPKPGYSAVSADYRYSVVQSVFSLDYIFNSVDQASTFQELFVMRIYMSQSVYVPLPVLGKTCVYIDEIAAGEIDKFDRTSQGTLLSIPVDIVLTYPLIVPVLTKESIKNPLVTERKPLITDIKINHSLKKN